MRTVLDLLFHDTKRREGRDILPSAKGLAIPHLLEEAKFRRRRSFVVAQLLPSLGLRGQERVDVFAETQFLQSVPVVRRVVCRDKVEEENE